MTSSSSQFPKGVSAPAKRALNSIGISRLEQLVEVSEAELAALHGMGPKALGVLKAALEERGLAFKPDSVRQRAR